jgi:ABC-type multidrug transport system fused ATPase/permease subunit
LEKANFEIKNNTSTAIVGPSGSGKSTIVQLLLRYYDLSSGSIKFGDTDIKNIDLNALREQIGYVSQEPVLIIGSIRENLMYGNKDATEDDLKKAIT